jgi:hypothetical protein
MTGLVYPHHLTYIACLSLAVEDAIFQNKIKVKVTTKLIDIFPVLILLTPLCTFCITNHELALLNNSLN